MRKKIYQNSKNSKFYSLVKKNLNSIAKSKLVLEHGCSIGIMTSSLADCHNMVFGIDRSFSALRYAKKSSKNNLDYIVADSLSPVFGKLQFDLIQQEYTDVAYVKELIVFFFVCHVCKIFVL